MNPAHVHLMLNHIPLIGIGFAALLLIVAVLRKSNELINVALIFTVLVGLLAIPAYLTGEPAEEMVEEMASISKQMLENHEEQAELAFIFAEITGAIALIALIARRFSVNFGQKLAILTILALFISGGLMAWTANLGGKIHHEEIRSATGTHGASTHVMDEEEKLN